MVGVVATILKRVINNKIALQHNNSNTDVAAGRKFLTTLLLRPNGCSFVLMETSLISV